MFLSRPVAMKDGETLKKILIIEDEGPIRELLFEQFSGMDGFSPYFASDGEEGISKAREVNPDVILLDVRLPKLDGFQVSKAVREVPSLNDTKILMISGMLVESDLPLIREAGANSFITKPFRLTDLLTKINELLEAG